MKILHMPKDFISKVAAESQLYSMSLTERCSEISTLSLYKIPENLSSLKTSVLLSSYY